VEEGRIRKSLDEGDIVLLTSLGSSPSGEMFSVASEGLASKVAASLKCDKIVYYLSSPFTLVREAEDGKGGEEKIVQSLRLGEAKEWLEGEVRPRNEAYATFPPLPPPPPHTALSFFTLFPNAGGESRGLEGQPSFLQ
jgi:acetylglutamate kinase